MSIIASVLGPLFSLLRWLGPWTDARRAPGNVSRAEVLVQGSRPIRVWVLAPTDRKIRGALLVCPGLHYAGPADPRFLRFASVLAAAGILVYAPFLPDFLELRVAPSLAADLDHVFGKMLEDPLLPAGIKPGIFSISFGSLPVLLLAASEQRRNQVGAVVIFGGYADFENAIRFALGIDVSGARDPLNQPVVFMNLIEELPIEDSDRGVLLEAWRKYVVSTWGRPEMKARDRYEPIAREIAQGLDGQLQSIFLIGCGLEDGAFALAEAALSKRERIFLDPRPALSGVQCRVELVHGLDDDVIPHTQMAELERALPAKVKRGVYLTGLYGHTGASPLAGLRAAIHEGVTLLKMLRALVKASMTPK
jgi:pimeloyl-ACP methyl ester carboxylesterase